MVAFHTAAEVEAGVRGLGADIFDEFRLPDVAGLDNFTKVRNTSRHMGRCCPPLLWRPRARPNRRSGQQTRDGGGAKLPDDPMITSLFAHRDQLLLFTAHDRMP